MLERAVDTNDFSQLGKNTFFSYLRRFTLEIMQKTQQQLSCNQVFC